MNSKHAKSASEQPKQTLPAQGHTLPATPPIPFERNVRLAFSVSKEKNVFNLSDPRFISNTVTARKSSEGNHIRSSFSNKMRVSVLTLCLVVLASGPWSCTEANTDVEATAAPNDPEALLEKWRKIEKGIKWGIGSLVKQGMPTLLKLANDADISNECQGALLTLVQGLLGMNSWAFQMVDAIGKPKSAMLMGTLTFMGSYDECVAIKVKKSYNDEIKFTGKYCTVELKPPLPPKPKFYTLHYNPKVFENFTNDESIITLVQSLAGLMYTIPLRLGVCIPSTCSDEDLSNIIELAAEKLNFESRLNQCETEQESEWSSTQVVVGSVFLAVAILNVLCTLFHILYNKCSKDRKTLKKHERPLPVRIACSISLMKSFPSLFGCSTSLEPKFLHAFRTLSLGWIILASVFLFLNTNMLSQMIFAKEYANTFWLQFILNGTLGIETLIFSTAYLLGHYARLRKNETGNVGFFGKVLLARIIRILPIVATVMAMGIMYPLTTSGPFWREVALPYEQRCTEKWWTNLLFINNFLVDPNTRCLYNSWLISCEMQLFVIGLLFIATLNSVRRRFSLTIAIFIVFASIITTGVITAYFEYPPMVMFSQVDFLERSFFENLIQQKPFSHLSTWFIGLLAGYYLTKLKKVQIKSAYVWIIWITVISCMSALVFGIFEWNRKDKNDVTLSTLYSAIYRPAWSVCLVWLSFVCSNGNAKTINSILCWSGWIPMSRICYFFYLIFPLSQDMVFAQGRELVQVSLYLALFLFSGVFVLGGLTSLLCSLLVQQPVEALVKVLSCRNDSVCLVSNKPSDRTLPMYDRSMSITSEASLCSRDSVSEVPGLGVLQKRDSQLPISLNMA